MDTKFLIIVTSIFLAGCGGGGVTTTTATGLFKDSSTAGLLYVSGGQSGVTGADGSFTYEVGRVVTFSIGGVTIGTSSGKALITPVDLVSGGSSTNVSVQNIVRFLLMLDDDGDSSNGINISSSVQTIAANWSPVDFTTGDLPTALTSIISDAATADGGTHSLSNATVAQAHLEATLLCSYAGAFKGTYSGTDNGNFGVLVDALTGHVTGVAYSIPGDLFFTLSGTTPISYDQNVTFISGVASTGATYSGQFTSANGLSGTWANSLASGSFSGSRIGGVTNAVYRFTGNYGGSDSGLFSFDIDGSNNVTGIYYSVAIDELGSLSGTVVGTTLAGTTSGGATLVGTLNTGTGVLSNGIWNNSPDGGTFSGSGCKLN